MPMIVAMILERKELKPESQKGTGREGGLKGWLQSP